MARSEWIASGAWRDWIVAIATLVALVLLCLALFAYYEPVIKPDEEPADFKFEMKMHAPPEVVARPAPPKETRVYESEARGAAPPRRVRTATQTKSRPTPVPRRAAPERRLAATVGVGGGGGGGPMLASTSGFGGPRLEMDAADELGWMADEVAQIGDYQREREQIRNRATRGRGRDGDGDGGRVGGASMSARAIYTPKPRYPKSALDRKVEGYVRVRVMVSTEGKAEVVEIIDAEPESVFEESVKNALADTQFTPAMNSDGRPIEDWVELNYVFNLRDA
ncbi:MAG: energy transducer TonB [Planctomycetota bacterium]